MSWIKNVLLEVGREEISKNDIITKTKKVSLCIEDGIIKEIAEDVPENAEEVIDAKGYLREDFILDTIKEEVNYLYENEG